MSEYRHQPLTDQWILIAGNRETRPSDYVQHDSTLANHNCPFCVGNESETPKSILTFSDSESSPWCVRVFENKYPALTSTPNEPRQSLGPYESFHGFGRHELIVLSPRHVESFSELSSAERRLSLLAFQKRLVDAYEEPSIQHAVVFQNCRLDAGASIQHVHCQLMGTTLVPPQIEHQAQRQADYRRQQGRSLLHELVATEQDSGQRTVAETDHLTAFCPFASRQPYEVWIAPKLPDETDSFFRLSDSLLDELSELIQQAVVRLEHVLPQVAYNTIVHLPPKTADWREQRGTWYTEIFPRINKTAGFEWATGCMINQVPPEVAARRLRKNSPSS